MYENTKISVIEGQKLNLSVPAGKGRETPSA